MNHLLEINNLYVSFKIYEGHLHVLDGVSLTISPGERIGLVGESGCGKTTLGRCVVRLVQPTAGQILFFSKRLGKTVNIATVRISEWKYLRKDIQMIFQDPGAALNPVFTVGDQLLAAIRYGSRVRMGRRQLQQAAIGALKEVQLPDPVRIMRAYPFQLSGGMRQRVCIAMALATKPELLIADEPTTSLDVTIQDEILRLLRSLVEQHGASIIFITHSLGVAREVTKRIVVMYAGTIVEDAPIAKLFTQPLHPYTAGLLNSVPKLTGEGVTSGIAGKIPNYLYPPGGCRFHPRCLRALPLCRQERPPSSYMNGNHRVACWLYRRDNDG